MRVTVPSAVAIASAVAANHSVIRRDGVAMACAHYTVGKPPYCSAFGSSSFAAPNFGEAISAPSSAPRTSAFAWHGARSAFSAVGFVIVVAAGWELDTLDMRATRGSWYTALVWGAPRISRAWSNVATCIHEPQSAAGC